MIFKWGIQTWTQSWGGGSQVGRGTSEPPNPTDGGTTGQPWGHLGDRAEPLSEKLVDPVWPALPSDSSGVTPVSSSDWLLATPLPSRLTHC